MSFLNTTVSWHVGKATGRCAACGVELPPNTLCWAALCDGGPMARAPEPVEKDTKGPKAGKKEEPAAAPSPFLRLDFCEKCWGEGKRPENITLPVESAGEEGAPAKAPAKLEMFSFWQTTVPVPQQKKKLLVDDSVLMDVFNRMEGKTEPQEVRFRFVLALILMRKRLLKYEGMEEAPSHHAAPSAEGQPRAPETWRMVPRGENAVMTHVINPHLTAEQISEVSQQLSAILAEEV
jgi:hypothetical protein